jgi:hypothetical protein
MGDDADPVQAVRVATEYLKTYPQGSCAADARTLLEEMSDRVPPATTGPYGDEDKAKEDGSKEKKDGAPAPSGSASAAPAPSASAPAASAAPKAAAPAAKDAPPASSKP